MADLLPVGTYVRVTMAGWQPYVGRVVDYGTDRAMYELGVRYHSRGRWVFADGGAWGLPHEVEAITEAEALRVGVNR